MALEVPNDAHNNCIEKHSTKVPGLTVITDFVNGKEEQELVDAVDEMPWSGLGLGPNPELKRRTQQYGHLFSYRYRKVLEEFGRLPEFATLVVNRILDQSLMKNPPNHLLVNEYNAGQGIMPHIDAPGLFGPVIISLSLQSACVMKFTHTENGHEVDVLLPRRSLAVLSGSSRYEYKHGISKDLIEMSSDGVAVHRDRRVSFTFREIIAWEAPGDTCNSTPTKET